MMFHHGAESAYIQKEGKEKLKPLKAHQASLKTRDIQASTLTRKDDTPGEKTDLIGLVASSSYPRYSARQPTNSRRKATE